jgi:hypothetical protein
MERRHVLALVFCAALTGCSTCPPGPSLTSSRREVDMGRFKVGQEKECTIRIRNITRAAVAIDHVAPSCACLSACLDRQTIPAGGSATLPIAARREYPGRFAYSVAVVPKDGKTNDPLQIAVRGEIRSPVSAQTGWEGGVLQEVTWPAPVNLGVRPQATACPVLSIAPTERFDLPNCIVDVNSLHFTLDKAAPGSHDRSLVLTFRPKEPLPPGRLQDRFEIDLRDGSTVYVPIACRITGDVYLEEEVIHLGRLADAPERNLRLRFADTARRWSSVRWEGAGLLREALILRQADAGAGSELPLVLSVEQGKLAQLPQGYLFCRAHLYGDANEPGPMVLIDGFR